MAIDVHQCPRCELRFTNGAELREHLGRDHRADPAAFARYRYAPRSSGAAPGPVRRYLVVANQTLGGEHLERELRARAGAGPARFVVLVPATPVAQQPVAAREGVGGAGTGDDPGTALARWRLRAMLEALDRAGIAAEGQVGHPDPYVAVVRVLAEERVDEILLSTLPAGVSRWLDVDLPLRLQRRTHVPVTTVTAEYARPG